MDAQDSARVQETGRTDAKVASKAVGRRRLIKGTVAVAGGVVAAGYVRPDVQSFGVAYAQTGSFGGSKDPTPLNFGEGSPGFWGPKSTKGGGNDLWNTASDPQWTAATTVDPTNPFSQGEAFTAYFKATPNGSLDGTPLLSLLDTVQAPSADAEEKAGRQLVAAYLNASYYGSGGIGFVFTKAQLTAAWNVASTADDDTKYEQLENIFQAANVDASLATLQALPGYATFGLP